MTHTEKDDLVERLVDDGEMAGDGPSENEIKLHNYDAALRNIAGKRLTYKALIQ